MTSSAKHASGTETVRTLARLALSRAPSDLDAPAMRQAQLLLLDTLGCGIAGAHDATARAVTDIALSEGALAQCALIGRPHKTSLLNAVLANGVAVRVLDFNDYFIGESNGEPETAGHPSDNIPVALAVGSARGCSGAEILASIVVGYELYARLQHLTDRDSAWDAVTTSGFVAPAMAGRLLGLDADRLAHALALGAARAATPAIVRSGHISAAKSIANALVAQSGVQAALFAEAGLTGPLPVLDDARGLRDIFASGDVSALLAPMPAAGAVMRAHVKAYPCVNTGQSAVAAALHLHKMLDVPAEELASIELVMADYTVVKRHQGDKGRARPASREAADHSFPFIVAVTLIDGAFGVAQFGHERWRDPKIVALMEKIVMQRDAALNARAPGAFPCRLRARKADSREYVAECDYPPGFSRSGLDEAAVVEKFHAVTTPYIPASQRARIVAAVMDVHQARSTAALEAAISTEGTQQ
jgi:2-methylcitrate dehydratase